MENECVLCGAVIYRDDNQEIVCEECIEKYDEMNDDRGMRAYGKEDVG